VKTAVSAKLTVSLNGEASNELAAGSEVKDFVPFRFNSGRDPYGHGVAPQTSSQPSSSALVAHVLRRLTFGPASAEQIAGFAPTTSDPGAAATAAIDWALASAPLAISPEKVTQEDWDPNLRGWVDNMRNPNAGVHEKMTWFWHSHFAVSSEKVGNPVLLHGQQRIFRNHALGNFRDLLLAVMKDAAMLLFLDSSGSSVESPNENLSRESMELFAIGRGNFTEADVKAGALALAGWDVNYETSAVTYVPERGLGGEVLYLGRRGLLNVDEVVDVLCSHQACAPHVASKVYRYFVGVAPSDERLKVIADEFRSSGLNIATLVESIVRGDEFLQLRLNRPRYAIEWWGAAISALGPFRDGEDSDVGPWTLEQLDQLPYKPPNVAGWSPGAKWVSASQQLTRASYIWGLSWRMRPIEPVGGTDLVGAVLQRCSLHEVSDATLAALRDAATATAGAADALSVSRRLITVALCSPEFALA
jgi:uncharacterized protein (DUF1800 family)